jgi:hypothetical protein
MTRLIASREGAPAGELPSEVADPVRERSRFQGAERVQASIALFCGLVALGIAGIAYLAHATPPSSRWAAWRSVTLGRVILVAVTVSVAGMDLFNTFKLAAGMVDDNAFCRGHTGGGTGVNSAIAHGHFREASSILDRTAADVERRIESEKNVLALLRSIDEMPLSEKRASLLYIPKSNRQFWELLHGPFWPLDGPLVAPALSGVAMIDGLCDRTPDTRWYWYSYDLYPQPDLSRRQPPLAQYLPDLRSRCARMGCKRLIVIDTGPDGLSRQQTYDCLP